MTEKTASLLADLRRAVDRLRQALDRPEDEFLRDACIQRFEFSFELSWKGVQALARLYGQECPSPRAAFSTALRNEWIHDEESWLDMLEARNLTSHTYRESVAQDVYRELPRFADRLADLSRTLDGLLAELTPVK